MTTTLPPPFQPPTISIDTSCGTPPVRLDGIKSGDIPIFVQVDAGTLHHMGELLYVRFADRLQYARLAALAKATGRPLIFVTTFLELQAADYRKKEDAGAILPNGKFEILNLRFWGKGGDGRGIVKEFRDMRCSDFGHQHLVVPQNVLEGVVMESCYEDLRPRRGKFQNITSCPPLDRKRNDLRIDQFVANAAALEMQYPGCDVHTFLWGERIAARYHEISLHGQGPLHQYGNVRLGEVACEHWFPVDIDILASVNKNIPVVQPKSYPHGVATSTGWTDLTKGRGGNWGKWEIAPKYTPQSSVPSRFRPRKDWVVRFSVDANVLEDREAALVQFANRFVDNVKFMGLPAVKIEVKRGGAKGKLRLKAWKKFMNQKPSEDLSNKDLPLNPTPMVYGVDKAPALGKPLTGDLAIRAQLGLAIERLVKRFRPQKKKVVVVFVTEDYIGGDLTKSVLIDKNWAVFKCLRIDEDEKGNVFEDLLWNAVGDYCEKV